jgi:MYXO-CTERM domain-containing protein
MKAVAKMLGWSLLAALLTVTGSGVAQAQGTDKDPCTNDIDCGATPACGGKTCDWDQNMKCMPAGGANKGWCTVDSDCKCAGMGAKCDGVYCTFTTPKATGAAGTGATGAAGTGAAGSATGAAGSATGAAGSTTGAAGATGAAGTGSGGGGGGGCSVGASSGGLGALLGLALVVGGLARRRRRG